MTDLCLIVAEDAQDELEHLRIADGEL